MDHSAARPLGYSIGRPPDTADRPAPMIAVIRTILRLARLTRRIRLVRLALVGLARLAIPLVLVRIAHRNSLAQGPCSDSTYYDRQVV